MNAKKEKGSIELIVLGLLAALIVVLAVPLLTDIGGSTEKALSIVNSELVKAVGTQVPDSETP